MSQYSLLYIKNKCNLVLSTEIETKQCLLAKSVCKDKAGRNLAILGLGLPRWLRVLPFYFFAYVMSAFLNTIFK